MACYKGSVDPLYLRITKDQSSAIADFLLVITGHDTGVSSAGIYTSTISYLSPLIDGT